jgi:hypothetical protein
MALIGQTEEGNTVGHRTAILVLAAIIWLSASGPANAQIDIRQSARPVHVYGWGGLAYPIAELGDRVSVGYGGGVGIGVTPRGLSNGEIEFVLRGQYEMFPALEPFVRDITFQSLTVDIKYNVYPASRTNLYLMMGGGFARATWSEFESWGVARPSASETDPCGSIGIGVEYIRPSVTPFFQAQFKDVTGQMMGNYFFFKFEAGVKL